MSKLFLVQQRNKYPCVVSYWWQSFKNYAYEHSKIFSEVDNSSSKNADASTCVRHTQRTAQLEDSPYLFISATCLHLQSQNTSSWSLSLQLYFCFWYQVVNSYRMQKMSRMSTPICHPLAQEAAGEDMKDTHSWELDSNEVSEFEAQSVQKLVQHCAAKHPHSLLGLLSNAEHKYILEVPHFCFPRDWSCSHMCPQLSCGRSSVHLDSWACWATG